ncbi:hypothetical protein LIER_24127 [Lithospermum erythrorhizon]|uniref:Uncharacterized protein n=1 Tax=Lithospermum erythrorhizon TaxID=34254 RepID=A0AAV3R5P6_LITER
MRYVVMHKVAIANLVPTSNNINVSEAMGRVLYVVGSNKELDFGRVIFDQIVDHSKTGAKLNPIGFPILICSILIPQHPEIKGTEQSKVVPEEETAALLIKAYGEDQQRLEDEIQLKNGRVVEMQAKIQALNTTVQPIVNDPMTADVPEQDAIPPTVNDPASDGADDPAVTSQSHVLFSLGLFFTTNRGSM